MYEIYTDGASRGNPCPASWAFVVYQDGVELGFKTKAHGNDTNNAMELQAIKEALAHVQKNAQRYRMNGGVTIFTDSAFCVSVVTQWMDGWQSRGWQKKTPGPIKNLEIIKNIWALWHSVGQEVGNLQLAKVAGHSGNVGNERADELCNKSLNEMK